MTDEIAKLVDALRGEATDLDLDENRYGGNRTHPISPKLRGAADALEAEHQRAARLSLDIEHMVDEHLFARAEGERDALRTAIQEALRVDTHYMHPDARGALSRATGTKGGE